MGGYQKGIIKEEFAQSDNDISAFKKYRTKENTRKPLFTIIYLSESLKVKSVLDSIGRAAKDAATL